MMNDDDDILIKWWSSSSYIYNTDSIIADRLEDSKLITLIIYTHWVAI